MSRAKTLDQQLRGQVQTERKITHEILLTIQTIEITQCFLELGYPSLFSYLTQSIGYSEGAANRRISAARLLKQCPEVASKIQSGKINLSQMALAQAAIKQEEKKSRTKISLQNKKEILVALEGKNHLETQKTLLKTFPDFAVPKPKVMAAKNNKIQVNLEFSEEEWEKVTNLMAQLSHKVPDQKLESALLYWAAQVEKKRTEQIEKEPRKQATFEAENDVVTAEAAVVKQTFDTDAAVTRQTCDADTAVKTRNKRQYISVKTKHHIFQKALRRCEYISPLTGARCSSKHYLDIEHTKPLALGGANNPENLRIMCRAHNQLLAKQMYLFVDPG